MVEATNAALDLLDHAKRLRYLKLEGVERALWQARDAIDVALAEREKEQHREEQRAE